MRIDEYKDMIYACGRCNFCRGMDFDERCPEIFTQRWESSTARGRMAIARGILEKKLDYSEALAERIFGCFLCGRCREECKKAAQIDITEITKAMRADFVELGIRIPEAGSAMVEMVKVNGNIFADAPEIHSKWADGLEFDSNADILFYPGCLASHRFKEKTRILVQVLQAAGYSLDFLGDNQKCCGTPYWITGEDKPAREWAKSFVDMLTKAGKKEIITPCPSCYRAFLEEYPRLLGKPIPLKVRHTSEVLEEIVDRKKLKFTVSVNKTVSYHDPCEIGRYLGIYEPPRKVLRALPGVKLVEMSRNREEAFCCGGGGAVKTTYEDYSNKVAHERIRDFAETGAELLMTICPACEMNLTHGTYAADVEARVLDVAELMAVAAGIVSREILSPDYFPDD
ncbi:MAG: (Fe-S)-binding protein [Candidatus Thorarchaeota archaeon]|nr:(Fe-S)-binding protein [Candidatus Thorarchaeota archaeon]